MLVKLFLVISLSILVVSYPSKDENELVSTALSSATHLLKAFSKLIADDADKYLMDLNSIYKKHEIGPKADEIKSYLQTEYKKEAVTIYEFFKQSNSENLLNLKECIDSMKMDDPMKGKLLKLLHKIRDLNRANEELIKYVYIDSDLFVDTLENNRITFEHQIAEKIKKFETLIIEYLPKEGKAGPE